MTTAIIPIAFLIGRVLFALYWLDNARHHLLHSEAMVGYARSKGVKSPQRAIIGTGFLLAIGGFSILLGIAPGWGIVALAIFLLGVTPKMHAYWKEADPAARAMSRVEFTKNVALLAALLMILAVPSPWPYSLGW